MPVMAETYDFPPELVELRVELLEADAAWAAAGRDKEAAPDTVAQAYRRVHDLTMRLYGSDWFREHGASHSARTALREAAKAKWAERA